jgi:hypothetical protein
LEFSFDVQMRAFAYEIAHNFGEPPPDHNVVPFCAVLEFLLLLPAASPSSPIFFAWDVLPTGSTTFYQRQGIPEGCICEFEITIQGVRSTYTGGIYGVDADGDGKRDGSLTAEFEMISEVSPTADGQFLYSWRLSNLGTGAAIALLGSGPDLAISQNNPLLGTAGLDRLSGTSDDLPVGQVASGNFVGGPPTTYAWGVIGNPSTGLGAVLYGPAATPPVLGVAIDIKPDTFPNSINPKLSGNIPVAILTTPAFDAQTVKAATVHFGPTGIEAPPLRSVVQDVNGDGRPDLLLFFGSQSTHIACGQSSGVITGATFSGQKIRGFDSIVTAGCN